MSPETIKYEATDISSRVNQLTQATLEFYRESNEFQVDESALIDGTGVVKVSADWGSGYFRTYQIIQYEDGSVIEINSEPEGTWYTYDPKQKSIRLGLDRTSNGNAQWHHLRCFITKNEQVLEETSRIQIHTDLQIRYQPANHDGRLGFESDEVLISGVYPLSETDTKKLLPSGKFITLDDLLATVVDPARANERYHERIPELSDFKDFPKFDYNGTGPHTRTFVSTLDLNEDKIHGFAHPLKNDPNSWLIFTLFQNGEKTIGRALVVTVDRPSVKVVEMDGVPTILANVSVLMVFLMDSSSPSH